MWSGAHWFNIARDQALSKAVIVKRESIGKYVDNGGNGNYTGLAAKPKLGGMSHTFVKTELGGQTFESLDL